MQIHKVLFFITFSISTLWASDSCDLWLENVSGDKALNWVKKTNKKTADILENSDEFLDVKKKTYELLTSDDRLVYYSEIDGYYFHFLKDKNNKRGILRRIKVGDYEDIKKETWETVLDIDQLIKTEKISWVYKGLDRHPKKEHMALVSLSVAGSDAVVLREFNVKTKQFVKDGFYIGEAKTKATWYDENSIVIGTSFGKDSLTDSGYARTLRYWKRGDKLEDSKEIFSIPKDHMGAYYFRYKDTRTNHMKSIAIDYIDFYNKEYYLLNRNFKQTKIPLPTHVTINNFYKGKALITVAKDWSYAGANIKAGSLVLLDLEGLIKGKGTPKVLFSPTKTSSLKNTITTENYIVLNVMNNISSELKVLSISKEGRISKKDINIPKNVIVDIEDINFEKDKMIIDYTSFLEPTTIAKVDLKTRSVRALQKATSNIDPEKYVVKQLYSTSKDGTKIPYFVVAGKDVVLDGTNPTLLYGYGGFEISMKPSYSKTINEFWLKKGGIYVLSNIRGGGEFGPKWHQAAILKNKQKSYDDFISIAEDLIERGYTTPRHLGIEGGSNGGLLTGATMIQRPDLFNATIISVPLLDMMRYHKLLAGASWMGEYGNPEDPEMAKVILKYSPYQNVKKSAEYPVPLFFTSTKDDRVHPGHARKMARKMERFNKEFFYYENMEGGHGGSSDSIQQSYWIALKYSYLYLKLR